MIAWQWLVLALLGGLITGHVLALTPGIASRISAWWKKPNRLRRAVNVAAVSLIWAFVLTTTIAVTTVAATALAANYSLANLSQLGPIATALTAIVALLVGAGTIWQKMETDRREQWWKRTEWALGWAYNADHPQDDQHHGNERHLIGALAVKYQGQSRLAGFEESEFLRRAQDGVVNHYLAESLIVAASGRPVSYKLDEGGEE